MTAEGFPFNSLKIVKLKKMFNNVKKYYELVLAKTFWTIMGVSWHSQSGSQDPNTSSFIGRERDMPLPLPRSERDKDRSSVIQRVEHHTTSIVADVEAQTKLENIVGLNKRISVNMMAKIFKGKMSKGFNKWAFYTLPARRLEFAYRDISKSSPIYNSLFVARVGAIDNFSGLSNQIRYKNKSFAFKKLTEHMYNDRIDRDHDVNFNDKLELLNRNSTLMAEAQSYKEEIETLVGTLDAKDKSLVQANETVTILSLRINYMITHKFVNILEKVFDEVNFRHMNDSLDAMIAEANDRSLYDDQE